MKKVLIAAIISAGFITQPAFAKLQIFSFSGLVSSMQSTISQPSEWGGWETVYYNVDSDAAWSGQSGGVYVGGRFSGIASYDDDPANMSAGASLSISFQPDNPTASFTGEAARASIGRISDSGGLSEYTVISGLPQSSYDPDMSIWIKRRLNADGRVGFDLSEATAKGSWRSVTGSGGDTYFRGKIDSVMDISPVPEPSTYAMLLAGLGLLGAAARRKRKQR